MSVFSGLLFSTYLIMAIVKAEFNLLEWSTSSRIWLVAIPFALVILKVMAETRETNDFVDEP